MADAADGHMSGAEESAPESTPPTSQGTTSPTVAPSEASSSGGASASSIDGDSDLLKKIRELQDTQKALKDQKKKCATEIKNAMKRKKRLQGKASQLSDTDLVEVLRMRKAKKETVVSSCLARDVPEEAP